MDVKPLHITNWDRGLINDGRLADCLPCLKILEILLVFVSKAAYTTVKQKPAPNLKKINYIKINCFQYILN